MTEPQPLFEYLPHHPVTRKQIAPALEVIDPKWTEVVNGSGTLSGSVAIPKGSIVKGQILQALEPDESWIIVRTRTGLYPWNGIVVSQEWHPENGSMHFEAQEFRSWLYEVILGPRPDMTSDVLYSWEAKDQLKIAQDIISYIQTNPSYGATVGTPPITFGAESSGRLRDLNLIGLDFKSAGQALDSISQRDGGFEWTLEVLIAPDNLPRLHLKTGYPVLGSSIGGLKLWRTEEGGNIIKLHPVRRSTTDRVARQWTTGSGQPPDLPFAQDTDPSLTVGSGLLLREGVKGFNTVTNRTTLASHARSLRSFYSVQAHQVKVTVNTKDPDVFLYRAGDRISFRFQDTVQDMYLDNVRIVERTVRPAVSEVDLVLDINDQVVPQVDSGGAV